MKRRTRNYARRQLTWMRKLEGVRLTDVTDRDPWTRWPPPWRQRPATDL